MVKKTKFKFLLALMLIILLVSTCCYATETSDEAVTLSEEDSTALLSQGTPDTTQTTGTDTTSAASDVEWTYSDYFACDQEVTVTGVIDGNAYVIGNEVTIKGEIGGDLFVLANKLHIDGGYVYSSIFAMANEIEMDGISYDLYAMCSSFKLGQNGFIYRDMKVAGSNVSLAGRIRRDAYVAANSLSFDETVGTIVYGDLNYTSSASEYTAPEGTVAGEVKYTQEETESVSVDTEAVAKISTWAIVLKNLKELLTALVTTLIVALLFAFLAPKFKEKIGSMKVGKSFASLGIGILAPVVLGIACVILIIIASLLQVGGLGLSVSASAFFVFITLGVVATAVTCTFFGNLFAKLIKKDGKLFYILFSLVCALVLWIIGLIPLLGGLVVFLAWAFGVGAVLINLLPSKKAKAE